MKPAQLLFAAAMLAIAGCADSQTPSEPAYFEEKTSEGAISVSLTPQSSEGAVRVKYSLNTHTIDLSSINLQKQVKLQTSGSQHAPANNPALSGHHASGILEFNIKELKTPFSIVVKDIPDTETRTFEWP